jgi:fatty acid desaturase
MIWRGCADGGLVKGRGMSKIARVEWPTLLLLIATYAVWGLGTSALYAWSPVLGVVATGVAVTQFASLQHEAMHGHPFRNRVLNEALVFPALTLTVPYGRFRNTHMAHHFDPILTDPYDDPESNYFDPAVWGRLPRLMQLVFRANNSLLGRMLLGPLIGNVMWLVGEARLLGRNAPGVRRDWGLHVLGLVPLAGWLWWAAMPFWAYLLAVFIAHSLLKIRTFLEHRAHEDVFSRTAIVEDRGLLALLFLNNNFHAVHHRHPGVPWYRLRQIYDANRAGFLAGNGGYAYRSYAEVFRKYLFCTKEPVPHPHYPKAPLDSL